jgi:aspartyl protease family protein
MMRNAPARAPSPAGGVTDAGQAMRGRVWLWVAAAIGGTGLLVYLLSERFPGALQGPQAQGSLIYYLLWLGLLGGALVMHVRHRPLTALKHIAVWAVIMFALIAGYSYRDVLTAAYIDALSRITGELLPQHGIAVGADGVRFRAARDGHFHVEAEIDQVRLSLVVDTGASEIVLTPGDARRLGYDPEALDYTRVYETANGTVRGAPIRLDEVRVGAITLTDVPASVNEVSMGSSLLGMSFLRRLSGYEVRGDTLTLWR